MKLNKKPKVSIIILNWNRWKDTIECLESLYQINYPDYDVIVLDNNSENDSVSKVKEYCKGKIKVESKFFSYTSNNKPIKIFEFKKNILKNEIDKIPSNHKLILIKNDKNYGFAEGNNIGMKFALNNLNPNYILLLNNDTVVNKDFLKNLVNFAELNNDAGIIGPKIYYYDRPSYINSAGCKIIWHLGVGKHDGGLDNGQFDEISEKDYLLGACLLINTKVIEEIGVLDSKFFLLFEDTDFCLRSKKAGYKVMFFPKSVIYHKEGFSSKISPLSLYYMYRNRLLFIKKHQPFSRVLSYTFYISLRMIIFCLILTLRRDFKSMKYVVKGHLDGLFR